MKKFLVFICSVAILHLVSVFSLFAQDSARYLPRAIKASITFSKGETGVLLQAFTSECMKFKKERKINSWEVGANYGQTALPFSTDSARVKSKITNTHLMLLGWRNYRYILSKDESKRIKFYLGWSLGGMVQYDRAKTSNALDVNSSLMRVTLAGRFLTGIYVRLSRYVFWNIDLALPVGVQRIQGHEAGLNLGRQKFDIENNWGTLDASVKTGIMFIIP